MMNLDDLIRTFAQIGNGIIIVDHVMRVISRKFV